MSSKSIDSINSNASEAISLSNEEILRRYNDDEANALLPVITYVSALMVAGLIGNSLVIYIYKFRFRRSSSRTFILCLAILDTAACAIGMPFHIADMLYPYVFYSSAACKSLSFIMTLVILASTFVLVLIASDRYQKICKPFQKQISHYGTKKACICLIFLAAIFAIPHLVLYGQRSVEINIRNITGIECYIADEYVDTMMPLIYNGILFIIFISSTITLGTLYCFVGLKVWRRGIFSDTKGKSGKDGNSSWKFCGNTSDTIEEEVFSENNSGKAEVKYVSYQKTKDGDRSKIEYTVANTPIYKKTNIETENAGKRPGITDDSDALKSKHSGPGECSKQVNQKVSKLSKQNEKGNTKSTKYKRKQKRVFSASESDSDIGSRAEMGGSFRRSRSERSNSRMSYTPKRQKRAVRITMMLFIITVVYVISFLPFLVISIMDAADETFWTGISQHHNIMFNFFLRTYFINNMVNPIIYGFLDAKFRSETSDLFKRTCGCFLNDD